MMDILLEVFGYTGTALILISMMMTSVVKLRIFNMAGSLISVIYAAISNTWPVVVLNASLFLINAVQLIKTYKQGRQEAAGKEKSHDEIEDRRIGSDPVTRAVDP